MSPSTLFAQLVRAGARSSSSSISPLGHIRLFSEAGKTIPINYKKSGEDPKTGPDDAYPAWLFSLDLPAMSELEAKGLDHLDPAEARRYYQLKSKETVKSNNEAV